MCGPSVFHTSASWLSFSGWLSRATAHIYLKNSARNRVDCVSVRRKCCCVCTCPFRQARVVVHKTDPCQRALLMRALIKSINELNYVADCFTSPCGLLHKVHGTATQIRTCTRTLCVEPQKLLRFSYQSILTSVMCCSVLSVLDNTVASQTIACCVYVAMTVAACCGFFVWSSDIHATFTREDGLVCAPQRLHGALSLPNSVAVCQDGPGTGIKDRLKRTGSLGMFLTQHQALFVHSDVQS